ncbi:MAG: Rho termination factor N-terminal domain-containing protein [Clostridia bacterium]|nr:Rho termination factor N-terminal domain-containing protein [Clostridia bacterium]MBR0405546.1 Rho termination factor N-terminal domain-containing protein [Eggerthellaceae bacterium]
MTDDDGSPSEGYETVTAEADTDESGTLTEEELNALTVAKLRTLAQENGITLTATRKADIIAEILAALAEQDDESEETT